MISKGFAGRGQNQPCFYDNYLLNKIKISFHSCRKTCFYIIKTINSWKKVESNDKNPYTFQQFNHLSLIWHYYLNGIIILSIFIIRNKIDNSWLIIDIVISYSLKHKILTNLQKCITLLFWSLRIFWLFLQ